jgi:tRNA-splicing ligase RtcB
MTTATNVAATSVRRVREHVYEIPRDFRSDMRVPARVLADEELLSQMSRDRSFEQLVNVATLPGIVGAAIGMPDMHEGYGFPVGGVAATAGPDGVVSPGGIGFDINCGVRLLASDLTRPDVASRLEPLVHELSRSVPAGFGRGGRLPLSPEVLDGLLADGCPRLIQEQALGEPADLDFIESRGCLPGADPGLVSQRAKHRGHDQLGTLGGGNHFLEVQVVDEVYDPAAADALGLRPDQVTVLLHTGSRGLGHQVCSDYVARMDAALSGYGITLPDRQLACAPLSSPEGTSYLAAMAAAANFGFCNRQVLTHRIREVFQRILGPSAGRLRVVYDVAHNTAKLESAGGRTVCVHRKGATRAFGPSAAELPEPYRGVGQPVFIPGTMGTASFVLLGTDASREISFSTTCHGAGRAVSRTAARRMVTGSEVRRELESRGIVVRCPSRAELAEEAPLAYKDVEKVVNVVHDLGIARRVARMRPLGVVKG